MVSQRPDVCEVFISYAGPDREVAAGLAAELTEAKVGMWWDGELSPGQPFEQQIQRILAQTKVIVAILSPDSLASEWMRWELSQASLSGLQIVPLLVNGARPGTLPPPLHLLPSLTLPVESNGATEMQRIAIQIRDLVRTINRAPGRQKEQDGRRRLASAAARTARQAADIKFRKTHNRPRPAIVVTGAEHDVNADQEQAPGRYTMSDGLVGFLHDQNIAVALTSHTGELYFLGRTASGRLMVNVQSFRKPTGLHVARGSLLVATLTHIYRMENILRPNQRLDDTYSHCYLPRVGHFTGVLDTHDVATSGSGEILFIASRFNCLATVSSRHSFTPVWRPSFISDIVAEDRCHLNGLAMRDDAAAYVTAVGHSNIYDGWREQLANGGMVLDVRSGDIVCGGLSMPHSPRIHDSRLWLLNSGAGELGYVDESKPPDSRYRAVAWFPGFTRGLAFHGRYALVGLSRPRYDDFAGLELHQRVSDAGEAPWCGIQIIDIASGECVHWFRIDGPTREIYDVAVLPDVSCPRSLNGLDDEAIDLITIEE